MAGEGVSVELYVEVQQFYARQMQALDSGKYETFAETFTEDGLFTHTPTRPAASTRAGIVADLYDFHAGAATDPVQRRHWFNMITLVPLDDGTIESTLYALVLRTRPGGQPEVTFSGTARDVLVRLDGRLHNRSRTVTHDGQR
ncbi:nuclear transport factor 2 family protein [Pseudofrankia inefficax]|uniref:Aromatic-ring-hydroxylating dioxygenase beta subunit n=1 Tax=Pseudofrankia inefficax (strain DSM 45817 / CECT 9037 / DDB 130130 / EuI1c) TaxID=298654 RepID=E3J3P6_PSEI1|nr:nuclear transport factor 2 family protein [Pseudofrankia inefficax]ADP79383.1 aromatic-ring-hydroxylating dioxygenase beta subunit [Pseudofrankia inefficax]